ncbi:MAG: 50S ribosomal protein L22 [Candidatus Omnitrophica bacterium]|nr:50S ribosomal protein L22 [Candidatus Omnitrophota bacterium]
MIAKAKLRYIRVSSRKADQVIRLVRGKPVSLAQGILANANKRMALILSKVLKSALTNAQNKGIDTANLNSIYISRLVANSGPTLKRFKAAAFGRATMIKKRTSHIELELDLRPSAVMQKGIKPNKTSARTATKVKKTKLKGKK